MRAPGLVEFVTIAWPYLTCVSEVGLVADFLGDAVHPADADDNQRKKDRRKRGAIGGVFGLACTITGGYAASLAIQKGVLEGCDVTEDFLPPGTRCHDWRFNIYLNPGCSCVYLRHAPDTRGCGIFDQDPQHKQLQPVLPHLEDTWFLRIEKEDLSWCEMIPEDYNVITSWTQLRALHIQYMNLDVVGPEFKSLQNLQSLSYAFSHIHSNVWIFQLIIQNVHGRLVCINPPYNTLYQGTMILVRI